MTDLRIVTSQNVTSMMLDNIDNSTYESLPENVKAALVAASHLCNIIEDVLVQELDNDEDGQ